MIEADFAHHYRLDLMDELRAGRSWRWFTVRLLGLLRHDTPTRMLLIGESPQPKTTPAQIESWLSARARRKG